MAISCDFKQILGELKPSKNCQWKDAYSKIGIYTGGNVPWLIACKKKGKNSYDLLYFVCDKKHWDNMNKDDWVGTMLMQDFNKLIIYKFTKELWWLIKTCILAGIKVERK